MKTTQIAAAAGLFVALAAPYAMANPDNPKFSWGNETEMAQRHDLKADKGHARNADATGVEAAYLTPQATPERRPMTRLVYPTLATQEGRDYRPN